MDDLIIFAAFPASTVAGWDANDDNMQSSGGQIISSAGMMAYQNSTQLEAPLPTQSLNDYDGIASVFDVSMGTDFANIILESTRQLVQRNLGGRVGICHLDLACGTGAFVVRLAKALGTDAIGIDLSKGQVAQARLRARIEGVAAVFRVGDIRTAKFPDKCDLVTCNLDALNHLHDIRDWQKVFRKVRACLNDGGMFIFDVNTPRRLVHDWRNPEIIIKPNLCYVQCGLELEKSLNVVRRKLLMQIFSKTNGRYEKRSALVEQTAVPNSEIVTMLTAAGFSTVKLRRINRELRAKHIFMRNRAFFMARI